MSPPLEWQVPGSVAEYAIVMDDPDARGFIHWAVARIPGSATGLSEGAGDPDAGNGLLQGKNDFGNRGYGGPCPPSGTHRYVFTLYAFPTAPSWPNDLGASDIRAAAKRGATALTFSASYGR